MSWLPRMNPFIVKAKRHWELLLHDTPTPGKVLGWEWWENRDKRHCIIGKVTFK